jgi:hypothetical protein
MANTWPYSHDLNPPFPIVRVRLFKPWVSSKISITESLQVDSGSDVTGIPLTFIRRLKPRLVDDMGEALDFDGNLVENLPVYELGIEILGVRFDSVRVYGLNSDIGFIGRELLNNFLVTLDGPSRQSTFTYT